VVSLPLSPRRSWLQAFWLVVVFAPGSLIALLADGSPRLYILLGTSVAGVAWFGLRIPQVVIFVYRIWNRAARIFAKCATDWTMAVCFYIVFLAVGRAGSALSLTPNAPNKSTWIPRSAGPLDASLSPENASAPGWIRACALWAARTSNEWTYFLIPFFVLLSALGNEGEEEEALAPVGIYTLF